MPFGGEAAKPPPSGIFIPRKVQTIQTSDHSLRIHSIESMGTHDGPGIRLVLFLQGCKLKCVYCHNPDTIDTGPQAGQEYSIDQLMSHIRRMKPYFGKKGGVTVSGGEPLLQSGGLLTLFKRLKEEGIHTNIDTNGRILTRTTKELLDDYTDLVMLDIKHMTEEGYTEITGLRNVKTTFDFAAYRERSGKPMWLRFVLIPGLTNKPELLHEIGRHFKDFKTVERFELLPYHKLGVHKWVELGWDYPLKDARENKPEEIEAAAEILRSYFEDVRIN